MINIFSILLLIDVCFGSTRNISYAVLNYTYTNVSELLKVFGESASDSGELIFLPNTNQSIYEYIINNRPKIIIVKKPAASEGPFYNLIVSICNTILHKFKSRKIPKYIKVLSESLRGLGHDYLKSLVRYVSKQLRHLSEFTGSYMKRKVRYFLKVVSKEKPRIIDFFKSMNSLYNIYWDNKIDEYIWLLQDFGRGRRRFIDQETRRLCSVLVFDRLYKQHRRKRDTIINKLMLAYREYLADRVRLNYDIGEIDE